MPKLLKWSKEDSENNSTLQLLKDLKSDKLKPERPLVTERENSLRVEKDNKEKESQKVKRLKVKPNQLKLKLLQLKKERKKPLREKEEEDQEKVNNDLLR